MGITKAQLKINENMFEDNKNNYCYCLSEHLEGHPLGTSGLLYTTSWDGDSKAVPS